MTLSTYFRRWVGQESYSSLANDKNIVKLEKWHGTILLELDFEIVHSHAACAAESSCCRSAECEVGGSV